MATLQLNAWETAVIKAGVIRTLETTEDTFAQDNLKRLIHHLERSTNITLHATGGL